MGLCWDTKQKKTVQSILTKEIYNVYMYSRLYVTLCLVCETLKLTMDFSFLSQGGS